MTPHLPIERRLTWTIAALAAVASGAGLLWPRLYAESALSGAMRGQDVVTLLAVLALLLAQQMLERGSIRALPVWLGLMGYIAYTYTGAAFAYPFNALFLVYIALFALSIAALWRTLSRARSRRLEVPIGARAPRRLVAAFLVLLALVLTANELAQIIVAWARGELPALIAASNGTGNFVYVLDLGLVVPLCLISAHRLALCRPGGVLLSASLLVLSTCMGLALLAMTSFQTLDRGRALSELVAYLALCGASGLLAVCLLAEWPSFRPHPSRRLDAWLARGSFSDQIAVRSTASPERLLHALARVRPCDMPLAMLLGTLRYLPARFGSARARHQAALDAQQPFLEALCAGRGTIVLERNSDELIVGTIGKLHHVRDQELVDLHTALDFVQFDAPGYDKLAMSLRAERAGGDTWLILEHRTRATTLDAARQFARYFRVIRPTGALVSRQLLKAAVRIAEQERRVERGLHVVEHG